ncbi:MAG: cyclopropane fatty acyl phospholipid synthase [Thermodesulfobacteriota bacterium]
MKRGTEKHMIQQLLNLAGIRVQGERPFDIQVHDPSFFPRVISGGSLALGESYMDRLWDCTALDQFFERILSARLDEKARSFKGILWSILKSRITDSQGRRSAFKIGRHHYDIGNDLFEIMLDKEMNYSCAYWSRVRSLDEAQEAKLELTCRKLMLEPGMHILDIGCGWGAFAAYAARRYEVEVTGITVSEHQAAMAGKRCSALPVNIELKDYRDIDGKYDRIVSIGMFEHVGYVKYRTYMETVDRCLKSEGLFLLHTIANNTSVYTVDPWIEKYIFPNSMLPSARQIIEAVEGLFYLEDWHSFGLHYDQTLMAWYRNFTKNFSRIQDRYDERFFRMWTYYLLSCAGSFRAGRNQLWQIVFSKNGFPGGYASIR